MHTPVDSRSVAAEDHGYPPMFRALIGIGLSAISWAMIAVAIHTIG